MDWDWTTPLKCPVCGKDFYITTYKDWAYKFGQLGHRKYFCSWSCLRKYEAGDGEEERLERQREYSRRYRERRKNASRNCDGNSNS